ncbi:unnamed protein product [Paramecium octaurelia]|uniref:Uncharacterized protein n=1 Tax=Paramecium octaurelia TaxID=43137 RepID=A0A8S1Y435_PAROT|nr:unnamed protein product [Paramecium octaurelia]
MQSTPFNDRKYLSSFTHCKHFIQGSREYMLIQNSQVSQQLPHYIQLIPTGTQPDGHDKQLKGLHEVHLNEHQTH